MKNTHNNIWKLILRWPLYLSAAIVLFGTSLRLYAMQMPTGSDTKLVAEALNEAGETSDATRGSGTGLRYDLDSVELGTRLENGINVPWTTIVARSERAPIYGAISTIPPAEAEAAAKRLQQIDAERPTTRQVLTVIKYSEQKSLLAIFHSADPHYALSKRIARTAFQFSDVYPPPTTIEDIAAHLESPRVAYTRYTNFIDRAITNSSQSWPEQIENLRQINDDYIVGADSANVKKLLYLTYADTTYDHLLETQLALSVYHQLHGKYPNKLSDLVPNCIGSVPTDPFSENQPLQYSKTECSYLLYSVGPDGNDDGGIPAILGKLRFDTGPDSPIKNVDDQGDIIAGISPDIPANASTLSKVPIAHTRRIEKE